jgi:prepilin-type N-terminal cleavage/methylation domain-containing protein/prepilin-type processing-associated H-X9-DG protein
MKHRTRAFTLIELLVVIAIIGILAALLFPALKSAFAARDEAVALSNMRQIGAAFILYANDNSYLLPGRTEPTPDNPNPDKWPALLAKYHSDYRVYASSYDKNNWINRHLTPDQVLSNTGNNTSYIMNGYNDLGAFSTPGVQVRLNAFTQTSNIILLGTPNTPNSQYYMDFEEAPNGNENDVLQLAAFNGGSNYLFADGSARFITQAAYNGPSPDTSNTGALETYGNWLWKVNKSYQIPSIGNGGQH